jgi:Ca2+-transporting ATPase
VSEPRDDRLPSHALTAEAVLRAQNTNAVSGLTTREATSRLEKFGPNRLHEPPPAPPWARLARQFREVVVWVLIGAVALSFALGEFVDALAILAIVVLNAALGFFQEERAARAIAALKRLSRADATVVRDGIRQTIPAPEVVPGDRIEVEAGDHVPADARLLHGFGLQTQESALTGESQPVTKRPELVVEARAGVGDRFNMIHMGTVVVAGRAAAVVTATGMATEIGRIAALLERAETRPTPLQRRMAEIGHVLIAVCLGIVAVIGLLQVLRGGALMDVLLVAVSLAVAAVPEGLPAVVTLALSLGVQRMARRRALVRRLPSVETLGSVTVICSDKTGTLTRDEMTVRIVVAGERWYHVSGTGYVPRGRFHRIAADRPLALGDTPPEGAEPVDPVREPELVRALEIGARCSHARVVPAVGEDSAWTAVGDPTEAALVSAAIKAGIEGANENDFAPFEIPFDAGRRMMTVVLANAAGAVTGYIKGAPEAVLARCTHERREGEVRLLEATRRAAILANGASLARDALRVLALAEREHGGPPAAFAEQELVFVGLAGMLDPPRPESRAAVEVCRAAGIRPVMITGDHPDTARAVAREVGIVAADEDVMIGEDLDAMTADQLERRVERIGVYARVSAEHKLRVVRALQARGHVVAMTGDGVNDAPAVRSADIGIAMGRTGTDVTREAADLVLLDDHFATIVAAVEEGRGIFDNIRKFVHYLLSTNAGEVLFMLYAALAGWPVPLLPIQILWINLVSDRLPALALGVERPEPGIMQRTPRHPRSPVIDRAEGAFIVLRGLLVAAMMAVGFAWFHGGDEHNVAHARVIAFAVAAYSQLLYAFAFRSEQRTLPELGLFSNRPLVFAIIGAGLLQLAVLELPFARDVFGVERPIGGDWVLIAVLAVIPVSVIEIHKLVLAAWRRWRRGRTLVERRA